MTWFATTAKGLWMRAGHRLLPFADAASRELPLPRLLRLSLFQVSAGMVTVLTIGTLNRVMIVELGVGAWLVAAMVALPLVFAPFRALVGHRSDHHRSAIGWRRVPYLWMGSLLQFCGLAFMPFALLLLAGDGVNAPPYAGHVASAIAFLLVGAGVQIAQTAGLALATDIAPDESRPRVVALMYVMLLLGMVASGFVFGLLLADFTPMRLVQVVQGAAVAIMVLNTIALWKQEPRDPNRNRVADAPRFADAWRAFVAEPRVKRFLIALGLGTAAFNMQDVVLEPYGGEVLGLGVGATTALTALLAGGALAAFALAARVLTRGADPYKVAAYGALAGLPAFAAVTLASTFGSPLLFRCGTFLIGFGGGLFAVGTLMAAMGLDEDGRHAGLALGAWGAVQATAAGGAIAFGGALRDIVAAAAANGLLGSALTGPAIGYVAVYHVELLLLFAALAVIGPLVTHKHVAPKSKFGLSELPS